MAPDASKIRLGSNILQVPFQNYTFGDTQAEESSFPCLIKTVIAYIWTMLADESQTVGNSPLLYSNLTLNPIYLPTKIIQELEIILANFILFDCQFLLFHACYKRYKV